jgi:hypothetical protein
MTPKEKAKELFEKFYLIESPNGSCQMTKHEARQCALIAVEEVIEIISDLDSLNDRTEDNLLTDSINWKYYYWRDVKTEIEKL